MENLNMKKLIIFSVFAFLTGNVFAQGALKLKELVVVPENKIDEGNFKLCTPEDGVLVFNTSIPGLNFVITNAPARLKNKEFNAVKNRYVLCVQKTDPDFKTGTTKYYISITGDNFLTYDLTVENINPGEGNAQYFRISQKDKAEITVLGNGSPLQGATVQVNLKDGNGQRIRSFDLKSDGKGFCEITIPEDAQSADLIVRHTNYDEVKLNDVKPGAARQSVNLTHRKALEKKFHFGIGGGVNLSSLISDSWLYEEDKTLYTGFSAGLLCEYKFGKVVSFQSGLLFVRKGATGKAYTSDRYSDTQTGNNISDVLVKNTMVLDYLELPLNLVFNIPVGDYTDLFIGAGYYFAYGINGKLKFEPSKNGYSFDDEEENVFSGKNKFLNPFDQGINCMLGIRIAQGGFIRASYEWSLDNIVDSKSEGFASFKNNCFTISLGYYF
ncbi:hypothetical protein FACS1894176_07600 [Bacteroidia bacterium]|nr:hypothetical protein FACS1894176_07600 [Bacteroidia bacterium]